MPYEEMNVLSGNEEEFEAPEQETSKSWATIKLIESDGFEIEVDWDRINWSRIRQMPSQYSKEIRRQWDDRNPYRPGDVDPFEYAEKLTLEAKKNLAEWKKNGDVFFGVGGVLTVNTTEGPATVAYPEDYAFNELDEVRERTDIDILMEDLGMTRSDAERFVKTKDQLNSINRAEKNVCFGDRALVNIRKN